MNHLHAYWRMEYIESPRPESGGSNPFREALALGDDRAALILRRSAHAFIMLNKFPYNAGHLLVLPQREVADLADLSQEERSDLMEEILAAQTILKQALKPDGFNIGFNFGRTAGAGIPAHLHAHVVPRWNGDTNFMPVLSRTRVLPESLDAMYERLSSFADSLNN